MGFTSIEVVNMLKDLVAHSVLMNALDKPKGKLCKYKRPLNSAQEDVVINGLPLVKDDVDEAVLNVNIYVPNLKLPDENDKSQPDNARLLVLSKLGNRAFTDNADEDGEIWADAGEYCFKYQQDTVMEDDNNQHYVNFRIEFYSSI
jgi:hypothetical protein